MAVISIINGPNLNLLGIREPEIYGQTSWETFQIQLSNEFAAHTLHFFQSNTEGTLIDELQRQGFTADGIILNAGAYTHTSIALADAIRAINCPVIEVHLSNIYARETYRAHSFLSPVCKGVISGLGLMGYRLALKALLEQD